MYKILLNKPLHPNVRLLSLNNYFRDSSTTVFFIRQPTRARVSLLSFLLRLSVRSTEANNAKSHLRSPGVQQVQHRRHERARHPSHVRTQHVYNARRPRFGHALRRPSSPIGKARRTSAVFRQRSRTRPAAVTRRSAAATSVQVVAVVVAVYTDAAGPSTYAANKVRRGGFLIILFSLRCRFRVHVTIVT